MTIKAYLYNKCSTCTKAKKWLEATNIPFQEIAIVDNPPTAEELRTYWQNSGIDLKKFFNVSGQFYRELGLKDRLPSMSEDEMLDLLASNGKLIKRPLITDGQTVTLGFKEEDLQKAWGNA
ncbi:arsenate reductase family protein [Brevibacillus dissolubilis]|uniref:arsenate reductase family protein n=1 Tax=Brevibacillus dissolubilis TaxID=1844116 RepID=UPI001116B5B1|nr:arsenate reductase family protein [Brevibacillus dissolubilis]